MPTDIILNKVSIIRRCIKRIHEEYDNNLENLNNFTKQDAIILNIQRACEAAIDIAMHIVSEKALGLPQNSRDAFDFLYEHHIIDNDLAAKLKAMVGFRNIAVHDYQSINIKIIEKIIALHLDDLLTFAEIVLKLDM
ncbi:type VII toxin-antitoxin system HepT family RNase toxin [Petroclostridium xylanilyticum]|uniref:type VII toxin-antitoxin system HepT family RNase toxin n=1 Tax=Petroclostridium xylanilyticum TaxID=1792311 RepID=UPI000B97F2E7|nr:DUF86 domain-containing protein [Petroclostridium xylanilyticum]